MTVTYDKGLDIATANSRKAKKWRNTTTTWSALLDRLGAVVRTPETVAEYRAMTKDRQQDVKDVGGFVGGYCDNGLRTAVRHRSLLCLDADLADANLFDDFRVLYGCAAAMYTTHKHTPEKPRIRLVLPLSRNVSPDEYQAVGRKIAADLGIDKFDDTSYEPWRLMFYPSASVDGEFLFDHIDAPLLDPDAVLATYVDWRDISSWPISSRVAELAKKSTKKQEDPTAKPGIVGAFCRAYTITEAIERFVPAYVRCDAPDRYTYEGGSTAAGVVIYDDKFSYSHHATDPASGQLCNAFDLVRLHSFRDLDANSEPDTPITGKPSYKAMTRFASEDERVRAQIVTDRMAEADADFATPLPETTDASSDEWKKALKVTEKGGIACTIENIVIILNHDPRLAGMLGLNEMSHDIVIQRDTPWAHAGSSQQWADADDAGLRFYLEKVYGISSKDKIFDAVNVVAAAHGFHPVREYLSGCTWDGVTRAETLLIDYLGAEDTPYTRAVTRKTLVAAIARVMHPGCKFDYMLTIRGRQGLGKSGLIAKLGGQWFSDSFSTLQGKEAYEQVLGVWIMEVGELAGMKKAEAESIKLYISKQTDRFRPAYGRRTQEYPRQCIFIGTTNETQFLRDTTGNRRFWVVDTPNEPRLSVWDDLPDGTVRQIWAEAAELYKRGEDLYLTQDIEQTAREIQNAFEEENPRAGVVAAYLDLTLPDDWDSMDVYTRQQWLEDRKKGIVIGEHVRNTVCSMEIWAEALGGNPDRLDRYGIKDINAIMQTMPGWVSAGDKMITTIYGRQRYYRRRGE